MVAVGHPTFTLPATARNNLESGYRALHVWHMAPFASFASAPCSVVCPVSLCIHRDARRATTHATNRAILTTEMIIHITRDIIDYDFKITIKIDV